VGRLWRIERETCVAELGEVNTSFFDCWLALFGNRAAGNQPREVHSVC
jgi:hypothetical protein